MKSGGKIALQVALETNLQMRIIEIPKMKNEKKARKGMDLRFEKTGRDDFERKNNKPKMTLRMDLMKPNS